MHIVERFQARAVVPPRQHKLAQAQLVKVPPTLKGESPTDQFQAAVLWHLFRHRRQLKLVEVWSFRYAMIDGAIVDASGDAMAVEVKLRMNWTKACQAGWQIDYFFNRKWQWKEGTNWPRPRRWVGGLVICGEFQGSGWDLHPRGLEWCLGWDRWFQEHDRLRDSRPLVLVQYIEDEDKLVGHPRLRLKMAPRARRPMAERAAGQSRRGR